MDKVIDSYSREQAVDDGVLVDVTGMAVLAGFKHPTAITAAVWDELVEYGDADIPEQATRLLELLGSLRAHCTGDLLPVKGSIKGEVMLWRYLGPNGSKVLKTVCSPGDTAAPVLTIMWPEED